MDDDSPPLASEGFLDRFLPGVAPDFGCYITIANRSDYVLGLVDSAISGPYGTWGADQPLSMILPKTSGEIVLHSGDWAGSQGRVCYEVAMGDDRTQFPTFTVEFDDPRWSPKNTVEARSSDDSVVTIHVGQKTSGHPLRCTVTVDVKLRSAAPEASDTPLHANFDIGFKGPLADPFGKVIKRPIHESIAIAAMIQSKMYTPRGTGVNNLMPWQWEFVRGLIWNDDPSCYLFLDNPAYNHEYSQGVWWVRDFKLGDPDLGSQCIIQRSHFGDLQFLHAMATAEGEPAGVTQQRLLAWIEVMYKLACGNQSVAETDTLNDRLPSHFRDSPTPPRGTWTLRDLLLASTPSYHNVDAPRRALGSCLHIVADSYAVGHAQRRLRNPQDLLGRDDAGYLRFERGTYGDWGDIITFHTYGGQNADRHSHYDGADPGAEMLPRRLDHFDAITGARNAIDACTRLIDAYYARQPWADVREMLERDVFALDPENRPSDHLVDDVDPRPLVASSNTSQSLAVAPVAASGSVLGWQAGLEHKISALEKGDFDAGVGGASVVARWSWRTATLSALLSILFLVISLVLTFLLVELARRV